MSSIDKGLYDRLIGNSLQQAVESQRQLDATIARLAGRERPTVVDQYKVTSRPGHGPGTYTPQARATGRDLVSLFIPDAAFKAGDWQDFQRAASEAISWLRSNRYQVEQGGALCHGPAFGLDPEPLSYRDSSGTAWFNCGITEETDFLRARVGVSR